MAHWLLYHWATANEYAVHDTEGRVVRLTSTEGAALSIKEQVQKITNDYYEGLCSAHERGKLVAWCSSVAPQEFLEAMDIEVAYPENHAAAVAAKGGALELLDHAEQQGYHNDICAYARINLAYADLMDSPIQNLPRPDFVTCTSNICNTLIKWYENLARTFHVPFLLIDTPFNPEETVSQNAIGYIKAQLQDFVRQLEIICKRPFNYKKFESVMDISIASSRAWMRAMHYASQVPSPLDGFNILNYMALAVCMRGRQESVDFFNLISDEMERMMDNGESQFKGEQKYRYMWEGIAVWPYLSHNYKTLKNLDAIFVGSTYPRSWDIDYEPYDIDAMALAYSAIPPNVCLKQQVELRASIMKECHCDGALYHMNRSCKLLDLMQQSLRTGVHEKTGAPYTVFDGDQADPRSFAKAQFETRVQALVESMAAKREEA